MSSQFTLSLTRSLRRLGAWTPRDTLFDDTDQNGPTLIGSGSGRDSSLDRPVRLVAMSDPQTQISKSESGGADDLLRRRASCPPHPTHPPGPTTNAQCNPAPPPLPTALKASTVPHRRTTRNPRPLGRVARAFPNVIPQADGKRILNPAVSCVLASSPATLSSSASPC